MAKSKICTKCGIEKPLSEYYKDKTKNDGHRIDCKRCSLEDAKKYRGKNKAILAAKQKEKYHKDIVKSRLLQNEWRSKNKIKINQRIKEWKKENKKRLIEINREYRKNNKNIFKTSSEKYAKNNPDKIKQKNKNWRDNNKEHIRLYDYNYKKNKRIKDTNFRIITIHRSRIQSAIKNQSGAKAFKTIELLGCAVKECRKHIEKQFLKNMSWDNYGKWHIDHILPCNSFDLTDPKQQKICFHYTNLQPLWAIDNIKKGSKILI